LRPAPCEQLRAGERAGVQRSARRADDPEHERGQAAAATIEAKRSLLRGVPWARIGEFVGQRNLAVTANTYSHVLVDEAEVEYAALP
jgi:hypothetical protein